MYSEHAENKIVITARLDDRQKNISMLLRAFKRFSANYDYQLLIIGDGPDQNRFQQYIDDNGLQGRAVLLGRQPVYEYLCQAKIFVLPSNYEGMPNSLIETMAAGLPCIAADCSGGGAAALIQDHVNGILIQVGDENGLVQALEELADNSELRNLLSRNAYEINAALEFNHIIEMWMSYIESVYASRSDR